MIQDMEKWVSDKRTVSLGVCRQMLICLVSCSLVTYNERGLNLITEEISLS